MPCPATPRTTRSPRTDAAVAVQELALVRAELQDALRPKRERIGHASELRIGQKSLTSERLSTAFEKPPLAQSCT